MLFSNHSRTPFQSQPRNSSLDNMIKTYATESPVIGSDASLK